MNRPPSPTLRPRTTRAFGLDPGQAVGGYRIVAELGGGGMGVVYVGEHMLLGRRAAIKVLRPEHSHQPELVQRFFAEARATTAIRHPGIVEVYDFGYTDELLAYLVMELLEGVPLSRRLSHGQTFPVPIALPLTRRIALALSAAHERGIVHRDVKPDNIFLVRDGDGGPIAQVKLLDFGIARLIEDGVRAARQTQTGVVMGTPTYMSPEQCRGAGDCDHRSDLYSLGCVLFEMLAGRAPFGGDSVGDLLVAHLSVPAPDVRAHAPGVPEDVAVIIDRLLAKDPAHRFETARALVAALDGAIERHGLDRRSAAMATVAAATPARGTAAPATATTTGASHGALANDAGARAPRGVIARWAIVGGALGLAVAATLLVAAARRDRGSSVDGARVDAAGVAVPIDATPHDGPPIDAMPADAATPDAAPLPTDAATRPADARPPRRRNRDAPEIDVDTPVSP